MCKIIQLPANNVNVKGGIWGEVPPDFNSINALYSNTASDDAKVFQPFEVIEGRRK